MELPDDVLGAVVHRGRVRDALAGATALNEWVQATDDQVQMELEGVRILIRGGDEVVLDVDSGTDVALVEALLYGGAARTVLLHRGTFSLHASLVQLGDRSLAMGGHSGAGKSTTATALAARHGGRVVIDDLLPVDLVDGRPVALPFPRPVHLTQDACARLGLAESDGARLSTSVETKLAFDIAAPSGPVPLRELASLATDEAAPTPWSLEPLAGAERLRHIVRLSNVSGLASFGARSAAYFAWSTGLADALTMVHVVRHPEADSLAEVCDALARPW